MTTAKDGGSAFPKASENPFASGGMTLRDYFAAKAMQGLGSNMTTKQATSLGEDMERLANACYELADAMLKAREA